MIVEWSPRALRELLAIDEYLSDRNPTAASAVVDEIIEAGESLAQFPSRGRPSRRAQRRELFMPNRPYFLVYRVLRQRIRITRVIHTSRDWPSS
jgi:toxin ParE1/3/4